MYLSVQQWKGSPWHMLGKWFRVSDKILNSQKNKRWYLSTSHWQTLSIGYKANIYLEYSVRQLFYSQHNMILWYISDDTLLTPSINYLLALMVPATGSGPMTLINFIRWVDHHIITWLWCVAATNNSSTFRCKRHTIGEVNSHTLEHNIFRKYGCIWNKFS